MNTKHITMLASASLIAILCSLNLPTAQAQNTATAAASTTSASEEWAQAEVRKIDLATGKVTLKHGTIKSLDMPPMTMIFNVDDKALLNNLQVGAQIQFKAVQENNKLKMTAWQVR